MRRIYRAFKKNPWLGVRVAVDRLVDRIEEHRLGIRTAGFIPIETLIENWKGNHDYAPTSMSSFRKFIDALNLEPDTDVFVDLGCGKGRVLVMAAQYPFKRIEGVEISATLADQARRNIAKACGPRECHTIEIWNGSAHLYPLPSDASVIYVFNPFHGAVLERVLEMIHQSLILNPRRIRVIYNNTIHFQKIAANYPWLRAYWNFSFEHDCTIYESCL
jgi:trans-aconitate methyltransferase